MRNWASLPFDHPLEEVWIGILESDTTRATSYHLVWWLKYDKNIPMAMVEQVVMGTTGNCFFSLLEEMGKNPVVYVPFGIDTKAPTTNFKVRRNYYYTLYYYLKPTVKRCPPLTILEMMRGEMRRRLKLVTDRVEKNSFVKWDDMLL